MLSVRKDSFLFVRTTALTVGQVLCARIILRNCFHQRCCLLTLQLSAREKHGNRTYEAFSVDGLLFSFSFLPSASSLGPSFNNPPGHSLFPDTKNMAKNAGKRLLFDVSKEESWMQGQVSSWMGDEVARLYEDEDGDDDGDEDVGDEGFRPPLKRPLRLRHVRLHGLPYSGGEGSFLYEDESGALKPHYAFQDSPQAPRAAPLAQDIEASADREGIPLAFRATASAAVGNFFRSVDFRPLDEAAAAFQQKQHGGEDVKGGGDATASNVTGGGAEGASSTFIPDEELQHVLEGYEELASKLSKLNEETTSPSLPCNTCALVYSREKEGTEFASLHDMKELHAMGQVAVLSAIEITYFAVNPFKP